MRRMNATIQSFIARNPIYQDFSFVRNTVKSRKFKVIGTRGFISKYRKFE